MYVCVVCIKRYKWKIGVSINLLHMKWTQCMLFWPFMGSINTLLASAVLTNSKFGLFYFLFLTPTFSKVPIEKIGKTLNFSGKQQFYSYCQNPSERLPAVNFVICWWSLQFGPKSGPLEHWAWSGSKLFDTEIIIWKSEFWKMSAEHKKAWKKKQHAKSSFESESNLLFGETELTLCSTWEIVFRINRKLASKYWRL